MKIYIKKNKNRKQKIERKETEQKQYRTIQVESTTTIEKKEKKQHTETHTARVMLQVKRRDAQERCIHWNTELVASRETQTSTFNDYDKCANDILWRCR